MPLAAVAVGALALSGRKKKKKGSEIDELDDADVAAGDAPVRKVSASPKTREQQTVLHELGYGSIVGTIDGKMGANTRTGIKTFQREYTQWSERRKALEVDGKWGPNTSDAADHALRMMAERGASTFGELIGREQSGGGTGGGTGGNAQIRNDQQWLKVNGYNVPVNGTQDNATRSGTRKFQQDFNIVRQVMVGAQLPFNYNPLEEDGALGTKTRGAMNYVDNKVRPAFGNQSWQSIVTSAKSGSLGGGAPSGQTIVTSAKSGSLGGGAPSGQTWGNRSSCVFVSFSSNHNIQPHSVQIPQAFRDRLETAIKNKEPGTIAFRTGFGYGSKFTVQHDHRFNLGVTDRQRLSRGEQVTVTTRDPEQGGAHTHKITLRCT